VRGTMSRMPSPLRSVRTPDRLVDSARDRSVSFPPPATRADPHPPAVRPPIPVGPGRQPMAVPARSAPLDEPLGFPIQLSKIQPPALRAETLERPRLLDWLRTHIHSQVVLVLADAGFGKTTLLADFSRRTRLRTLWYRLERSDQDWATFLRHLIAAGREYDSAFAPTTSAMLESSDVRPSREQVVDQFLLELPEISTDGAALILDDFHLVDEAPDCLYVVGRLLASSPDGWSTIFLSRRAPNVGLGRLRAFGEVAELRTDDLRFDLSETTLLFRDTYGRRLEADVVETLTARTEGWIASLHLVHVALRDRSPADIRRFVKSLSGADRDLYDYLAEVVVGELPDSMQRFLMTTSVLQVVTRELARMVSRESPETVDQLLGDSERLALLSRVAGGPRTHRRYHPLVREFLEGRLVTAVGAGAVAAIHRDVAEATAGTDWRLSAHHFREAGDLQAVVSTLNAAIPTIMANAQYMHAESFITEIPADRRPPGSSLVTGRIDLQRGDYEGAAQSAQAVLDASSGEPIQRDHALLNLLAVNFNYGHGELAFEYATALRDETADGNLRSIAEASIAILQTATERDLDAINRKLRSMARHQREGQSHHFGVTMYNLATNSLIQDRLDDAEHEVGEALHAFSDTSSVLERRAAEVLRVGILLRTGRGTDAVAAVREVLASPGALQNDALLEAAGAFDAFGSREMADELLDRVGDSSVQTLVDRRTAAITRARAYLRRGNIVEAEAAIEKYPEGMSTIVGMTVWRLVVRGQIALMRQSPDSASLLRSAASDAAKGGIHGARREAELLAAVGADAIGMSRIIRLVGETAPWHLTSLAEVLVSKLPVLDAEATDQIARAVRLHPDRWRTELRSALNTPETASQRAANLLELVGDITDVERLRRFARAHRKERGSALLGRGLARRLADQVMVEDQGRVTIRVGERQVAGASIRRKVLGLLCYLLSRPEQSATRDQVLDALWPDLDPETATNSLNQTLYFLRRVFEEEYAEDLSPGYVRHEGDVIWLDPDLVSSRSGRCLSLMRSFPSDPPPDDVQRLSEMYRGRFALDFEYEEWASSYRDSLHARYLEVVERSLLKDVASGHHARAIAIARRALEVDPRCDQIEVSLLRLYKATSAHAAAAEQYAHYATVMREELGIEPPTLDSL
jgi:LuxR family maltose regulon positive regulatory protein